MSGAQRLARVIGLQHRLTLVRLAQAQASVAVAEARADFLDDIAAGLIVRLGGHGAAQLATQSEMAERLRGAKGATEHGIAIAIAERDHHHRAAQRLDRQKHRLIERQASNGHKDAQLVLVAKRQQMP